MNESRAKAPIAVLTVRWIARVWSIASVGFVLLIVAGELVYPHAPPPSTFRDLVGLLFFPFGTCVGMILAWRWEGLGGGITVVSLLAFYAALRLMDGQFPRGPYFALVAAPGALFLASWAITAARKKSAASGGIQ
jgi:hypothetical protein